MGVDVPPVADNTFAAPPADVTPKRKRICKKIDLDCDYWTDQVSVSRVSEYSMTDWSQILDQHGAIVWKTVYRLVNNDSDAADCFQDTFVSALEFSRQRHVNNWPGLLKRLATIRALDQLRKRRRKSVPQISAAESCEIADDASQPSAVAEGNEFLEKLRQALADLPPQQAEACCLRLLEGQSYDQIAQALNVSVKHVGVLLNRAKASLRKRLMTFAPDSWTCDLRET